LRPRRRPRRPHLGRAHRLREGRHLAPGPRRAGAPPVAAPPGQRRLIAAAAPMATHTTAYPWESDRSKHSAVLSAATTVSSQARRLSGMRDLFSTTADE